MRCGYSAAWVCAVCGLAEMLWVGGSPPCSAQQAVFQEVTYSPCVIGFRPVVNNGAVGGVLIDARGVVTQADTAADGKLRAIRQQALTEIPADIDRVSALRKVSLRGLEQAVTELRLKKQPISDELQNLAGLLRIRYVFGDRERRDIVLAGPAVDIRADCRQASRQSAIVDR